MEPLWTPSTRRVADANLTRFAAFLEETRDLASAGQSELWEWSVSDPAAFWDAMWDFGGVVGEKGDVVVEGLDRMPGAKWFPGATLNFAENLLAGADEEEAIVFVGEGRLPRVLSGRELRDLTARVAAGLRAAGVGVGDRVAGFMPNVPEAAAAMLATTSLGAVWSSCSPDFGIRGVLDRFGQIEPKVLFTADAYHYGGKVYDCLARIGSILRELPQVEQVVVIPYVDSNPDRGAVPHAQLLDEFAPPTGAPLRFEPLPFDHPVYIMYSSGTTGAPKCIVHGAGGTLLQHKKEHLLHTDVKPGTRIFYFTTCGWMMWNWLMSALASRATVLLYDGAPFHPDPDAMWRLAETTRTEVFGTSAKYLAALSKSGAKPRERFDLGPLRTILSTGSPLSAESFRYVYRDIKSDVCLSSITGGTDLISCFALGNPVLPVYPGELQCRGLGMNVHAFDEEGNAVIGEQGELVCTTPFPSMPVGFWNDPDGRRYREAYFERYPGVWHHGDYMEVTERGGVIMHGRSDATLNPGGVRIGTAEIYRLVENFEEVQDSLVVGQRVNGDERVILFLRLREGATLDDDLEDRIRRTIRAEASPRHVPAVIREVADIPYTISGKKVELAVRKVLHGEPVKNRDALANPESLDLYKDLSV